MKYTKYLFLAPLIILTGCQTNSLPQSDPGGRPIYYTSQHIMEIPELERPNDATISQYEDIRKSWITSLQRAGNLYTIRPKGNAETFKYRQNIESKTLQKELSSGYILNYLYYDGGAIAYDGKPPNGRFYLDIDDETLFFTHSSGKSIISYIVGHAICQGYIGSIDETIDWPMMKDTLYQGQRLRDLLNMAAGDSHLVDEESVIILGLGNHRLYGLDTIAHHLKGSERRGNPVVYNNWLTDVIANYVAFRAGDDYGKLLDSVFQDSIRIERAVSFELRSRTPIPVRSAFYGQNQTRVTYAFHITRKDFLRFGVAVMRDYQNNTCVGQYLRELQSQARPWTRYDPSSDNSRFWLHRYARKYGGQFYFDFDGMRGRNIVGTEGKNGQNILIDMDNSRIVVTNSAATPWDHRVFILNVIRTGKLPE